MENRREVKMGNEAGKRSREEITRFSRNRAIEGLYSIKYILLKLYCGKFQT